MVEDGVTEIDETLAERLAALKSDRDRGKVALERIKVRLAPEVTLEPEATADEQLAYYREHPEQFERKPRANIRYLRLALPAEDDSLRTREERRLMARGRSLADTLRRGVPIDTVAAPLGGSIETGWFDLPATAIPGIGASPDLIEDLTAAERDTTRRVIGPAITPLGVVVGVIAAREPRRVPSMEQVLKELTGRPLPCLYRLSPCPCGSGRRYRECCLRKRGPASARNRLPARLQ